jgi:hypothetical protein
LSAREARPILYTLGPAAAPFRLEALLEETNCLAALRRRSKKKLRAIFRAGMEQMKTREGGTEARNARLFRAVGGHTTE